ncbi:MAG: fructose-bisphosphatase class III, partial [Clostridia bacterium]|nr:fructose-bisphosphatase class III [Clostridia bacterium]
LHIVGDIFDRGPRPDLVMDILMNTKNIDIQWGNHDIVWMGAMMGSEVCIAIVIANSLKYENILFLEEGYGVSLRKLESFAIDKYKGKDSIEKMYKAISMIRFKLEDNVMMRNPAYNMQGNTKLDKINFDELSWCGYKLNTDEFPTINRDNPFELTEGEQEIIENLKHSFLHSEKMQRHLKFLFAKGGIYLCYNGNLLYHGCIPFDEDGEFSKISLDGRKMSGKGYLDYCERQIRNSYSKNENLDFAWYLWCSPDSPLFGKKKMATFERMFLDDEKSHKEKKQPYFELQNDEEICKKILVEFGLDAEQSHIINGHIPVKFKEGEKPIKAGGKLLLIDGGMSKTYQKETGIAGYTLTFNSYGLILTSHMPFESVSHILKNNLEMTSQKNVVEKALKRTLVKDTDNGRKLLKDIEDLKQLMFLYNSGVISEKIKIQ